MSPRSAVAAEVTIRIAIIGYGKIARDQHLPSIRADDRFELAAVSTRSGDPGIGVPCFADNARMFEDLRGRLDAVAVCTPPIVRHVIAKAALEAGLHVMLEKPPAATLGEVDDLDRIARACGRTLFAAWHSQQAAAVPAATSLLAGRKVTGLEISWREDVRKWHPGQEWIWGPGGFGVFDPGINALSIATRILPEPLFVREANLLVPANRQSPIAARVAFSEPGFTAEMDWRHATSEEWTIRIRTRDGPMVELRDGGARLLLDGVERSVESRGEYPGLYDRFATLIAGREREVDREPLRIVADAFLVGRRETVEPFE
jgi:D-galactose 1-dehydrogenase